MLLFSRHTIQELVLGSDLALETGIFDFANVNFLQGMPAMGPDSVKAKGKDSYFANSAFFFHPGNPI